MAYNKSIPQAGDLLSQSQADILGNFTAIDAVFDVNNGVLKLPSTTSPTTLAGVVALYTKSVTITPNGGGSTTAPSLFWRPESSGTEVDITTATKARPGWCRLPCGIIMKWGSGSISNVQRNGATGTGDLIYGTNIPNITTLLGKQLTRTGGSSGQEVVLGYSSFDDVSAHTITAYGYRDFTNGTTAYFDYLVWGI